MGLAVGAGFFEGAVIMCVLLVVVIACLTHLDDVYIKSASASQLYLELRADLPLSAVLEALREQGWAMASLEYLAGGCAGSSSINLDIQRQGRPQPVDQVLERVRGVEGVLCAEQL